MKTSTTLAVVITAIASFAFATGCSDTTTTGGSNTTTDSGSASEGGSDSGADSAACGDQPVGTTCKHADNTCTPITCNGTTWGCAAGETSVAVVPGNGCIAPNTCGEQPVGSQCKRADGTCTPLSCIGTAWGCGPGEQQVAVVPGACN